MQILTKFRRQQYVKTSTDIRRLLAYRNSLDYEHWPEECDRVEAQLHFLRGKLHSLATKIDRSK